MATRKKAAGKKSSAANRKGKGKAKVEKVMHEFKHHELRSGGGRKVTNPKQAIAIALSEAREAGADIPEKPRRGGARERPRRKNPPEPREKVRPRRPRRNLEQRKPPLGNAPQRNASAENAKYN